MHLEAGIWSCIYYISTFVGNRLPLLLPERDSQKIRTCEESSRALAIYRPKETSIVRVAGLWSTKEERRRLKDMLASPLSNLPTLVRRGGLDDQSPKAKIKRIAVKAWTKKRRSGAERIGDMDCAERVDVALKGGFCSTYIHCALSV